MVLRQLSPSDAPAFRALRLKGLQEMPMAFASSYEEEFNWPVSEFELRVTPDSGKATFGAFEGVELVGVVGLMRETKLKLMHKAWIWGMYVAPEFRRNGVGKQLLATALASAEKMPGLSQVYLSVEATNEAAKALYESFEFEEYGREPCSMIVNGKPFDEILMARSFNP